MSRLKLAYQVEDISALARSLHRQMAEAGEIPSHLALMNMLARGAGFANYQALRASHLAGVKLAEPSPMADMAKVAQLLRYFDEQGRMKSWPSKTHLQHLCLWAIWARWPRASVMSEREASAFIGTRHLFGDAAIIRRTMWEMKLISRSEDGRDYRRIEQAPPPDARALIAALSARAG